MSHRWNLSGQRAIVTGASAGIGHAIAQELLALGATVLAVARDETRLDARLLEWREAGFDVHGLAVDVSAPDAPGRLADWASSPVARCMCSSTTSAPTSASRPSRCVPTNATACSAST